jgi:hypothetical protein
MAKAHNKRRNAGLLYEFLVKTISKALVEGDTKKSKVALRIIRRSFKPGSELYKEFRLINALVQTTVSNASTAASIIQEAKQAARSHDVTRLDQEKSLLISTINKALNDSDFYDLQVNEYKIYATVQTLLNDWRSSDADLRRIGEYEDALLQHLVTEKHEPGGNALSTDSPGTSRLMMKMVTKRLNEQYAGVLNDDQRQLVRAYAFSSVNDDAQSIKLKLAEIKQKLIDSADAYCVEHTDDTVVCGKLAEVRTMLASEELTSIDDDTVTRFMLYAKLSSEMTGTDNG